VNSLNSKIFIFSTDLLPGKCFLQLSVFTTVNCWPSEKSRPKWRHLYYRNKIIRRKMYETTRFSCTHTFGRKWMTTRRRGARSAETCLHPSPHLDSFSTLRFKDGRRTTWWWSDTQRAFSNESRISLSSFFFSDSVDSGVSASQSLHPQFHPFWVLKLRFTSSFI
jgi:hypothetical protein